MSLNIVVDDECFTRLVTIGTRNIPRCLFSVIIGRTWDYQGYLHPFLFPMYSLTLVEQTRSGFLLVGYTWDQNNLMYPRLLPYITHFIADGLWQNGGAHLPSKSFLASIIWRAHIHNESCHNQGSNQSSCDLKPCAERVCINAVGNWGTSTTQFWPWPVFLF